MDIEKEMELYNRCEVKFSNSDIAITSLGTIYLAKQLERYISPTLDMSLIIRYILDINSEFHYSNVRSSIEDMKRGAKDYIQHEYVHAKMLTKLCTLFRLRIECKTLEEAEAREYLLVDTEQVYFGAELVELNNRLVEELCPVIIETI